MVLENLVVPCVFESAACCQGGRRAASVASFPCQVSQLISDRHVVSLWQQLCTPQNVNCRDLEGRHSTPLHFAAGYNRVAVVEYLLHHGADVHAKDKG